MAGTSTLRLVFETAHLGGVGMHSADESAVVVTALALVALSDEVLTLAERQAFADTLERRFALRIAPEAVCDVLERVAGAPRHLLLREIETSCRGWPRERARTLMSALVDVVRADGYVAQGEHLLLRRFAGALGWTEPLDPCPPRRDSTVLARIPLVEGERQRVGRSLRSHVCLPRAPIAPFQLDLVPRGGSVAFENVGETLLVAARGRPVARGELAPGDELSIGRYRLRLSTDAYELSIVHPGFATTLEANDLGVAIRQDGRARYLLDGVTFRASAGDMVAVIGPSGSGKSTLLHVLRGDLKASRGHVSLDGVEVGPGLPAATRRISFVPQEELLLAALTVEEAVTYSAKLKGLNASGRHGLAGALVDEMLDRVGLSGRQVRRTPIGGTVSHGISGGQRRRVSVAQELVGDDTDVLLLDEPTSGLDPKSEAGVVSLLRDLCDGGRIVITSTHAVSSDGLRPFDKIVCLGANGRTAYVGPPDGLLERFQARNVAELFERLDGDGPPGTPASAPPDDPPADAGAEHPALRRARPLGPMGQLGVLLRRELIVRLRDPVSLALAVALPVAVAGLCSLVYYRGCVQPTLLFVLCLTGLWAGVSFTVRDIISHFAMLRHESRTRADLAPSYGAKAIVATGASAVQAAILAASLFYVFGANDARAYLDWRGLVDHATLMSPISAFLVLWACHVFGNAVGFVLSASFRTAEAAIFMIPFVILPMVALSGALVPPSDLPPALARVMQAAPLYQGYVGLLGSSATVCLHAPVDVDEPTRTDRSLLCDLPHRTVAPPPSAPARASFVQSESSCLHNLYQYTGDFCHRNGLPCRPNASRDPVGRQLNPRLVGTRVGTLMAASCMIYLVAFLVSRRRMRTL